MAASECTAVTCLHTSLRVALHGMPCRGPSPTGVSCRLPGRTLRRTRRQVWLCAVHAHARRSLGPVVALPVNGRSRPGERLVTTASAASIGGRSSSSPSRRGDFTFAVSSHEELRRQGRLKRRLVPSFFLAGTPNA